jgi:hypothetical protein
MNSTEIGVEVSGYKLNPLYAQKQLTHIGFYDFM